VLVGAGLIGGVVVGVVVSRMYRLDWDHSAREVVSRIDRVGALVLALYLVFAITRSWLLGQWVQGAALGPVSLSVVAGIMLGRVGGMSHGIRGILRDVGVY
jgi:membrane protein required for beta-lactamase induction